MSHAKPSAGVAGARTGGEWPGSLLSPGGLLPLLGLPVLPQGSHAGVAGRQKLLWGRTTAKTSVRAMKVQETRHNRESRGSGTLLKLEKQQLCPVWSQGLVVREAKLPGSGAWARYVFTPLAPVHVVLHWLL